MNPFWRAYFSDGLVQPPTSYDLATIILRFLCRFRLGCALWVGQWLKNWETLHYNFAGEHQSFFVLVKTWCFWWRNSRKKPDDMVDIQWYPIFLHYICTTGFYDTPQLARQTFSVSHTPKKKWIVLRDEGFYAIVSWCATWGTNVWNSHVMFILTSCKGLVWRKTC